MDVGLRQHLDVLKDLESLIAPSFGPCGRQVLITTETGLCMVTKDGKTILEYITVSHPISRWVVDRIKGHYRITGDGSKSFILLLTELLRRVEACHRRHNCQRSLEYLSSKMFCLEIANGFALLANEVLPSVLSASLVSSPVLYSAPLTEDPKLNEFAKSVIFSSLEGNSPQGTARQLGELAINFVQVSLPLDELKGRIIFATDNFAYLCQEVSGHSVTDSFIIDGVLIQRDFAFYDDSLKKGDTELRVILVACDFVTEHLPSNTVITISSMEQIAQVASSNELKWSRLVTRLQSHKIKLLVTADVVPEPLLAKLRIANISVIHSVPQEDLSQISQRTGVSLMSDLEEDQSKLILTCRSITRTILGKDIFSCVEFTNGMGFALKHLVVCGPTATICRSYSVSIQNALKALHHCLDNLHCSKTQFAQDGQEGSKGPASSQEQTENIQTLGPGSQEANGCLRAVYGGGTMEQMISSSLLRFSSYCTNEQLRLAATAFAEALEVIPRTLHNNSYSVNSKDYLRGRVNTAQNSDPMGIDARSGRWVTATELGIVDPLESKLSLWQSVLLTVCDLFRIDSVVGVKGCVGSSD